LREPNRSAIRRRAYDLTAACGAPGRVRAARRGAVDADRVARPGAPVLVEGVLSKAASRRTDSRPDIRVTGHELWRNRVTRAGCVDLPEPCLTRRSCRPSVRGALARRIVSASRRRLGCDGDCAYRWRCTAATRESDDRKRSDNEAGDNSGDDWGLGNDWAIKPLFGRIPVCKPQGWWRATPPVRHGCDLPRALLGSAERAGPRGRSRGARYPRASGSGAASSDTCGAP
jgi:hypothetical protein